MELQVQPLNLMPLTEVQEAEVGLIVQTHLVLEVQVTPLQLPHLKAVMVVMVIDVHQHTLTEAVVVEHPQ